jgi:hypothetical protein
MGIKAAALAAHAGSRLPDRRRHPRERGCGDGGADRLDDGNARRRREHRHARSVRVLASPTPAEGRAGPRLNLPIGRVLRVRELPRGTQALDQRDSVAASAGALIVLAEINTQIKDAHEAMSNIRFFGADTQFSISHKDGTLDAAARRLEAA